MITGAEVTDMSCQIIVLQRCTLIIAGRQRTFGSGDGLS